MNLLTKWSIWARSESEARDLQSLGWKPRDPAPTNHHANYALAHVWEDENYPPLPDSMKAGGQ